MLPGHEDQAKQLFKNAQDDYGRVRRLKDEIADVLFYACSQACAQRGVHLDERQGEELRLLLERFV